MQIIHSHRAKLAVGIILISIGFASMSLYMLSTIFHPLVGFNEVFGKAMGNLIESESDTQEILLGRYLGNMPLMIFGIISVVVGNWFRNTSKHIVNSVLAMSVIIFIIGLVAVIQILSSSDLFAPSEVIGQIRDLPEEIKRMVELTKGAMSGDL